MTLDHKTSHTGTFFEIEIYASPEDWMNKLSIDVWLGQWYWYLAGIQLFENLESEGAKKIWNTEDIIFKFVQIKFLAMHIKNKQKKTFFSYIYSRAFTKYLNETWYLINILMIFVIK